MARPISLRGRSTGECQAATWRWRQDTPASSQRTGCCAQRCSRTLRTHSPKAQRRESTCKITQITRRTDTRCAPAPLTPPRLQASAHPRPSFGCCRLSGRSRWLSALNCYDAKAWDRGPVNKPTTGKYSSYIIQYLFALNLLLFIYHDFQGALPSSSHSYGHHPAFSALQAVFIHAQEKK